MRYFYSLLFVLFSCFSSFAIAPITGVTHACAGSSTALADATPGGVWSAGGSSIATVTATGIVTGIAAGTVSITYTVDTLYVTTVLTINPLPLVFTVTGGGSYCAGGAGEDVGLSGTQGGINYFLHHGTTVTGPYTGSGGPLGFGLETAAGAYTVIAINTTTGCSDTMPDSVGVTITPIVMPSVTINAIPGFTVCAGAMVTINAVTSTGGLLPGYQWNVNGTNVGGDSSHYTYAPSDGDMVKIILYSDASCAVVDTVWATDTISTIPYIVPAVSISAFPGTRVCAGSAVLLDAVPVYSGPTPVYIWTKNGTYTVTGASYTLIPVNGDIIRCTMASDYQCVVIDTVYSPNVTMIVDTPTAPYITITASPGTTIGHGQADTLTAVVTSGGASPAFQWILNNTAIPGATNDTYISDTFSTAYPDSVTCVVTGAGACDIVTYTWIYIVVSEAGIPATGPAGGGEVRVSPNPAQDRLTIEYTGESELLIYDMTGRIALDEMLNGQNDKQVVDVSALPKGVYIVQEVNAATGVKKITKILKE